MKSKGRIAIEECSKLYRFEYPYVIPISTVDGRPTGNKYIPKTNNKDYPSLSFRRRKLEICKKVSIHRVVAYQKYGDKIFEKGILCRHLNNNKNDFRQDNIVLGTALDNHNDNSIEILNKIKIGQSLGAKKLRKLSKEEVLNIREKYINGQGVISLSKEFDISKCAMSYIVNYKTYKNF